MSRQFRQWVEEYQDQAWTLARYLLKDPAEAEDAVQEAFVALASCRRLPDDPMAWLVRVMRNRLLQWHRGNRRRRDREHRVGMKPWFENETLSAQQRLDAAEVTEVLQKLPSPDREIIVMHLWGEMSFESIARVVGGSRAKAHRSFTRGLATLRTHFEAEQLVAPTSNAN